MTTLTMDEHPDADRNEPSNVIPFARSPFAYYQRRVADGARDKTEPRLPKDWTPDPAA